MPSDLADKLWHIANVLTGFTAIEAVAYTYALGQGEFARRVVQGHLPWVILFVAVGVNGLLSFAIWWCHHQAIQLPPDPGYAGERLDQFRRVSRSVTIGRLSVVAICTVLPASWAFLLRLRFVG